MPKKLVFECSVALYTKSNYGGNHYISAAPNAPESGRESICIFNKSVCNLFIPMQQSTQIRIKFKCYNKNTVLHLNQDCRKRLVKYVPKCKAFCTFKIRTVPHPVFVRTKLVQEQPQ